MSIGNLKTDGNKGNNFPWQLKMLQGIQSIIDSSSGCCNDILNELNSINNLLSGTSRTPNLISATGVGATPSSYSISIANVGAAAGVINGVSIPAGTTINWDGGTLNNTIDPVSYNATGTTLLITYLV